jgi:hypothetical protein
MENLEFQDRNALVNAISNSLKVERFEETSRSKEELVQQIAKYQSKVIELRKRNQIGKIKLHTKRKFLLENYRLNKDNSKQTMDEYNLVKVDLVEAFFRNHPINRYMNESDSGITTQARLVIEGIMGVCVIDYIPMGWSDGSVCSINSIDKGNFLKGHVMIFANEVQPTEVHSAIPVLRFTKSRLIQIIDTSAAIDTVQMETLKLEFQKILDDKHQYTIREAFKAIGFEQLVNDYLDSNVDLGILVADDDVILKEMIDTNNIFNLWESVVYSFCSISKDRKDVDLGQILSGILSDDTNKYTEFLNGTYVKKLKDKLSGCKEYYLFPALLLEGYRLGYSKINSSRTGKKQFAELCEKYTEVNKTNWMNSPLVSFTKSNIIENKDKVLELEEAIRFISIFNDSLVKTELTKYVAAISELESAINKHISVNLANRAGYCVNNLGQFKFGGKSSEQVMLNLLALMYSKLHKKQSFNVAHVVFLITRMRVALEAAYSTNSKGTLAITDSAIKSEFELFLTKAGWLERTEFLTASFDVAYGEYESEYGSNSKNAAFRRKEKENIERLWAECLGKIGKKTPIPFVIPTGNLNTNEYLVLDDLREDYIQLEWSHIVSGIDKYPNGYLWGTIQRGTKAASKYVYASKYEAYTKMIEAMVDSKEYPKSVIGAWEDVMEYWNENYKHDLSDMK